MRRQILHVLGICTLFLTIGSSWAYGNAIASGAPDSIDTGAFPLPVASGVQEGSWLELSPDSSVIIWRMNSQAVYVAQHDCIVFFGGRRNSTVLADLWEMKPRSLPFWVPLNAPGTRPPGRWGHSLIYDPVRDRILMFGGTLASGARTNEVWELKLNPLAWKLITPDGTPPGPRYGHRAVYDSQRDRMVVFGGLNNDFNAEVWELSLASTPRWTQILPEGTAPEPRLGSVAVYDSAMDRMIVFGGSSSGVWGDTWSLSFAGTPRWEALASGGPAPPARTLAAEAYDATANGMWIFGGMNASSSAFSDTWFLSLGVNPSWSQVFPSAPAPVGRWGHMLVSDPVAAQLVLFGGNQPPTSDVWALSPNPTPAWTILYTSGVPGPSTPAPKWGQSAFLDGMHDRVAFFGGALADEKPVNENWFLGLGSVSWTRVTPDTIPLARYLALSAYDSKRNRGLVFGGHGAVNLNDTWAMNLTPSPTWSALSPAGAPPPARLGGGAIYDPVTDKMIVFGGSNGAGDFNDVWGLSLSSPVRWDPVLPSGATPQPRRSFGCAYDPSRGAMWVFGGQSGTQYLNDVWELSVGAASWTQVTPAGTPPSARAGQSLVYEASHDRLILFGGIDANAYENDLWELSLSGTPTWRQIAPAGTPPPGRLNASMIVDPTRGWILIQGGVAHIAYNSVWAWFFDQPTPTLVSWIGSQAVDGGLELDWFAPEGTVAAVERQTGSSDWVRLADGLASESQRIQYVDRGVSPGTVYTYRLLVAGLPYGEARVQSPGAVFQLAGLASNPGRRSSPVSFSLASHSPATLELFDVRGRCAYRAEVGGLGPGWHSIPLEASDLHAGLYWIRLRQNHETRTATAVILP